MKECGNRNKMEPIPLITCNYQNELCLPHFIHFSFSWYLHPAFIHQFPFKQKYSTGQGKFGII